MTEDNSATQTEGTDAPGATLKVTLAVDWTEAPWSVKFAGEINCSLTLFGEAVQVLTNGAVIVFQDLKKVTADKS